MERIVRYDTYYELHGKDGTITIKRIPGKVDLPRYKNDKTTYVQCACETKRGERCRNNSRPGSYFCGLHKKCGKLTLGLQYLNSHLGIKDKSKPKPRKKLTRAQRIENACKGLSESRGGMNVPELKEIVRKKGYKNVKSRKDLLSIICSEEDTEEIETPPLPSTLPYTPLRGSILVDTPESYEWEALE